MKIKQQYTPYWEWEDWINGMWRSVEDEDKYLEQAIFFTSNWTLYGEWMKQVSLLWPRTMLNSLTNPSINRRAFLGHCACSLAFNCPEYIVRMAWKELTEEQRIKADWIAEKTIQEWKSEYVSILKYGKAGVIRNYQMKPRVKSLTRYQATNGLQRPYGRSFPPVKALCRSKERGQT